MEYKKFLNKKQLLLQSSGFEPQLKMNPYLFDWQSDIVKWALRKGKACLFEDCGLGKTLKQLEWARHVNHKTNKPVIIFAPLAISNQTKLEGKKFGISVNICENQSDIINGINITNYEKIHKYNASVFGGIVLDESSILKNLSGYYRNLIIDNFRFTPYKLACTATPSPNDFVELGNHSEFIGALTYSEMLAMFFINDGKDGNQWRLKKYAKEKEFWKWVCSWAIMLSTPSDFGYDDNGFILPSLKYHEIILPSKNKNKNELFVNVAQTLLDRRKARKESIQTRCEKAAEIVNQTNGQWLVWCGLNAESELLSKIIEESVEITGSQDQKFRITKMLNFAKGKIKCLVTKPKIAGFGMNWQNCNKMIFVGLSDSWEQLYQATRRVWRFGQTQPVDVYIIIDEREGKVLQNIQRKDRQAKHMIKSMVENTAMISIKELKQEKIQDKNKNELQIILPLWIQEN
jgi:hypothetical protein